MIPKTSLQFKPSRTATVIVFAATLLASLLATVTISNLSREETLMENFLFHEGMTLIRSFEAGARTSMMHYMRGDNPLTTLVTETAKEPSVVYIVIASEEGRILASSGDFPEKGSPSAARVLEADTPIKTLFDNRQVFEVARSFKPVSTGSSMNMNMNMMMGRWQKRWGQNRNDPFDSTPKVIYLGLSTNEFDQARQVDVRHALILGSIVFLAGITGLYLLFVNQGMRVVKNTLADMELYTNNVIESMPAGLITLDNKGRVVSCNSKAENITGKKFADLEGKTIAKEIPSCPAFSLEADPLLDEPVDCPHGEKTIPVKVSSSKLINANGITTGLVLIIRDVREIHEMEQKLERSRRLAALGRMAAGIAHEIRNPLGTLRGFAQFFKKSFTGKPTEQEYATLMIDEVDRLNRTISGLLQFAKPRKPEFQDFPVQTLLDKSIKLLGEDCYSKEIKLTAATPADNTLLKADPDLVLQAIINILKNSIEASEKGGVISIGTETLNESVVIWVEDQGKGMSSEQKVKMFDPFYTTRKEGTGLGLAIVHQIIHQHSGVIEVVSTEGQGTKIVLLFPLVVKEISDEHA